MNELITVIIPVYNVESYLQQCIDSVLASTYRNLEILLINDGSTDSSGEICDEYAANDSRITVIHQKNEGLSAARNKGLNHAHGKYISFVDSDDMISPTMIDTLYWALTSTDADLAACEYTRNEPTSECNSTQSHQALRLISGQENIAGALCGSPTTRKITWTGPMVWNKLYLKDKIQIQFHKQREPAEDLYFNWKYCQNCNKMTIIPKSLYYWRITPQSITQPPTPEKLVFRALTMMEIAKEAINASPTLKKHLNYVAASSAHTALWRLYGNRKETEHTLFVAQARHVISCYYRDLNTHEDTAAKARIFCILCYHFFPLWKAAARLYGYRKKESKK